jgi:hypothetical protein
MDSRRVEFDAHKSKSLLPAAEVFDPESEKHQTTSIDKELLDLWRERQELASLLVIEQVRVGNLESLVMNLESSVLNLQSSLRKSDLNIQLMQNSRSWKYTRFLRGLGFLFGRITNKKK